MGLGLGLGRGGLFLANQEESDECAEHQGGDDGSGVAHGGWKINVNFQTRKLN